MSGDEHRVTDLARRLGEALLERGGMLALAESCTGGGIAEAVTRIPGSSRWFDRGFVTYSNAAKEEMLGVSPETLARWGAVSEQTVGEMAAGALRKSRAEWAAAVSGIAGPDGGTEEKPVGTVCFAWAGPGGTPETQTLYFSGNRQAVRRATVRAALEGLLERVSREF